MSQPYEEILQGTPMAREAPGARHETICARLHKAVHSSVVNFPSTRLLAPRAAVKISRFTTLRPDLSLIAAATGKLWLAAEIVSPEDHQIDTVEKKQLYEDLKLPRLWMVDPRYDNLEVYHGAAHGLMLKGILGSREVLTEKLLPEFQIVIAYLFATEGGEKG